MVMGKKKEVAINFEIPNKIKAIFSLSKDWADFNERIHPLSAKEKGESFEQLTKFYLLINAKYQTKLRNVWLLKDVPLKVSAYLNLPSCDEGIDLIAETEEGKFWAIQCKYRRDEKQSLPRKELSTFTDLAFNVCHNISHALICTNSIKLSNKFSLYKENVSFCSSEVWLNLDVDFFNSIRTLLSGHFPEAKKVSPRKHQKAAIESALSHFNEHSRGKLIHPCSAGKTLTAYWIARDIKAKTILIAVPNLSLINQTLEEWANRFIADNLNVSWICVCSDETVKHVSLDSIEVSSQDLGVEVYTDPVIISDWLAKETPNIKVVFSTYQSGLVLAKAAQNCSFVFDLAIMDEAHRTVGQKGNLFTHLLSDENIRISKRLFMTATERRFKGNSEEVLSMDNVNIYGKTIHLYTFKEAIQDGILSDYKISTISVTDEEIKNLIKGNFYIKLSSKQWTQEVEAQMVAAAIALRKAYLKFGFSHTISYHSSLDRANSYKNAQMLYEKSFLVSDLLQTFNVQGSTPSGIRSAIFRAFANADTGLITNVRCLTEGVNIPKIDCILFADPKKSQVDIVQAVGRALRPHKDKKMSYIIVPVLTDKNVDNSKTFGEKTKDALLQIISSLATQDERIIEYFRALSSKPKRAINRDYFPFEIDIPTYYEVDGEKIHNSIELDLWSKLAKLSWRPFEEAKAIVQQLKLKNQAEWKQYCDGSNPLFGKKPEDIPAAPDQLYGEWISWGDWLGTGFVATYKRDYKPFLEARSFVHQLKLKSQAEWGQYCQNNIPNLEPKPDDIPSEPASVYKNEGWLSVGDWLGTHTIATQDRIYRSFEEARFFVHQLGLTTQREWKAYCQGKLVAKGLKPADIPANPNRTYQNKGWINYGHWFGTGYIRPRERHYKSYELAKNFAHSLGLKSYKEWRMFCDEKFSDKPKKPDDIPAKPDDIYKNKGWTSWGDFLGTGNIAQSKKVFLPFEEAKAIVQQLKLKNQADWKQYCEGTNPLFGKKPEDIPAAPSLFYKEWSSLGDWLGTGFVACSQRQYRLFEDARKFAHSLNLKSQNEWRLYTQGLLEKLPQLPKDIPAYPNQTYKNEGYVSIGDWLGTGIIAPRFRKYRSFEDAKKFIHGLGIKSQKEWNLYCRGQLINYAPKPDDIPANPQRSYQNDGWISVGDWLGTGVVSYSNREYLSYEEAKSFVHELNLKNSTEWKNYCDGLLPDKISKPENITNRPEITYKNKGWTNWGDWLGMGYIPTRRDYREFSKAKDFVHSLKLITQAQWKLYCQGKLSNKPKIPLDIPFKPERTYKNEGWKGYPDWLGNKRRASPKFNKYLSFLAARAFAHSLKLKSSHEWASFCKGEKLNLGLKPQNIPTHPERAYADSGWKGYGDWLGTNNPAPRAYRFLSYEEAKVFVHQLNLKSRAEWNQYCSGKIPGKPVLPSNIPKDPNTVYRNKGWVSVGDWLGTNIQATRFREYLPFKQARSFVRSLNLKSQSEWKNYCKGSFKSLPQLPNDIPKTPRLIYKDSGWKSFSDWIRQIDKNETE